MIAKIMDSHIVIDSAKANRRVRFDPPMNHNSCRKKILSSVREVDSEIWPTISSGSGKKKRVQLIIGIKSNCQYIPRKVRTSNRYFLPQYAPDQVPARRTPIKIDQYFELDGTSQTDEWQLADNGPQNLLSLKSPSDLR